MSARVVHGRRRLLRLAIFSLLFVAAVATPALSAVVTIDPDAFPTPSTFWDRWSYPFNFTPGTRSAASTFGAFPDPPTDPAEFDQKDGQFLLVFDTATAGVPTGIDPSFYIVNSVRVTATHSSGTFAFDPSYDAWQTYLDPSDVDYVADSDTGRPIELYGIGLRNGYTDLSSGSLVIGTPDYEENEGYGLSQEGPAVRHAFPLAFGTPDAEGDASNNVIHPSLASGFDPTPFAIGMATATVAGNNVLEGTPGVSSGETFAFDLDLSDPHIRRYVQEGLAAGTLGFSIVSMHSTTQQQGGANPNFYTSDSFDPFAVSPTIEIDYVQAVAVPALPRAAHGVLGLLVFLFGALLHREIEACSGCQGATN